MRRVCHFSSVHQALDNRIFYKEVQSLHRAGYYVTIIAIYQSNEIRSGIQIIGMPGYAWWKRPMLWWKLFNRILSTPADLYHFHDTELLLIAPLVRLRTGCPIIYDVHELMSDFVAIKDDIPAWLRYAISWILRWLEPSLAHLVSGLIFADEQIAKNFRNVYKPNAVIKNYPSSEFLDKARSTIKKKDFKNPVILYLGGLKNSRGTRLMLQSFSMVLNDVPGARLVLVGPFAPASHQSEVLEIISDNHLENAVEITGAVPFESVHEYLAQAAIGWIPFSPVEKYQKNIPTKLFEYMAYGLPIVSSDLASIRTYIVHGQNGYLVDPSKPQAHAKAIVELLQNPQKAKDMGERGRNDVNTNYRWDEMEKRLLDLYAHILEN
jgi:glycosyltransferase involved in cell wall biosynthesis